MGTQPERIRAARVGILAAVTLALGVGIDIGFVLGWAVRPASPPPEADLLVQAGDLTPPVTPDLYGWRGPAEAPPPARPPEWGSGVAGSNPVAPTCEGSPNSETG